MQKVHCDGCGMTEYTDQPKHKIRKVVLSIVNDPRFPSGTIRHEADLCPTCIGQTLYTYFGVPTEGILDLPAFIHPNRRDDASEIAATAGLGIRSERTRLG